MKMKSKTYFAGIFEGPRVAASSFVRARLAVDQHDDNQR